MRTIIFDLDGTLADTSGDLIAAANACFADLGYAGPLDPDDDQLTAFAGARAMLRLGFSRAVPTWSEVDVDREYPRLLGFYRDNIDRFTFLYPGVEPMLKVLAARGDRLGICTNKPEALALALLGSLGIRDNFISILGADSLPVRKPDPLHLLTTIANIGGQPERAILIGDTVTDRDAARAANVALILVAFGPQKRATARLCPDALLEHFDDLPRVIDEMMP